MMVTKIPPSRAIATPAGIRRFVASVVRCPSSPTRMRARRPTGSPNRMLSSSVSRTYKVTFGIECDVDDISKTAREHLGRARVRRDPVDLRARDREGKARKFGDVQRAVRPERYRR
jgi:hypothetical protein